MKKSVEFSGKIIHFIKKAIKAFTPYGLIVLFRLYSSNKKTDQIEPVTVCYDDVPFSEINEDLSVKMCYGEALLPEINKKEPVKICYDDASLPEFIESISFVVVTSGRYLDRLTNLLKMASILADETVVILDNDKKSIYEKIKSYADTVVVLPGKGCFEAYSRDIFRYCTKTWILRVDDDETLSLSCTKEKLKKLISDRTAAAYWLPRKWFIDTKSFIISEPWYPDYQLRLFRNQICFFELPDFIHSALVVHGNTKKTDEFCLEHWDLMYKNRKQREDKVKYYDTLLPGNGCYRYYLYEDEKVETVIDR